MNPSLIRNFCIIAHIDHGKSTLADRFLEITGTVRPQEMKAQFLDSMDLERERGITIKGKAVTMKHRAPDGLDYQLNLIDTPGHVDFSYEVSRALAACEGALLVVDASQGIEAQTIANALLAMQYDLDLIPVVNKIDLPAAEPARVAGELRQVFGFREDEILFVSAKDGSGAHEILDQVVSRIPAPQGKENAPFRALVFDSIYDSYKGIIGYVRVEDGRLAKNERIMVMSTGKLSEIGELGIFAPSPTPVDSLDSGQVGYIATGFKDLQECSVGDTLTNGANGATEPLPGYVQLKSMVFAGLYPSDGEDYNDLRAALEKLRLNDASLTMEPENSVALGFRLPLRLPGAHAPGDRPGAAGARIQPRSDNYRAQRGVSGGASGWQHNSGRQSLQAAGAQFHPAHRGADTRLDYRDSQPARGRNHGADAFPSLRIQAHGIYPIVER